MKRIVGSILLAVLSAAAGVLLFEAGCRLLGVEWGFLKTYDTRYRLIGTEPPGEVYRNIDDFFLFQPDRKVRTLAWYDTPAGWVKEYDYAFRTNNLGLVQDADVQPGVPSLLVLGDSFTEGQGAAPWFNRIAGEIAARGYQPVNGGIFGTGFEQFLRLHDHLLRQGVVVDRVVVIFIASDYRRRVWNFEQWVLDCLGDYRKCNGYEDLFGLPPDAGQAAFIERLRSIRKGALPWAESGWRYKWRRYLPATSEAYYFVRYLVDRSSAAGNIAAIERLIATYGDRVVFVHIPDSWDIVHGLSVDSVDARAVIQRNDGRLFDGFTRCGITAGDFRPNDGHYTEAGYAKLSACVLRAIEPGTAP